MWKTRPQSQWVQDQRRDECSGWNAGCASWRPGTSVFLDEQLNLPKDPRSGCLWRGVCWRFMCLARSSSWSEDAREGKNDITSSGSYKITSLPKEQTPHWELGLQKPLFANIVQCTAHALGCISQPKGTGQCFSTWSQRPNAKGLHNCAIDIGPHVHCNNCCNDFLSCENSLAMPKIQISPTSIQIESYKL